MIQPVLEAPGIHRVDLAWNGLPGQVAGYLVEDGGALAVVECGPASTLPALLAAVRALGADPRDLTGVLVTHVHLDHAGAAGSLTALAPHAEVYVHPAGAPHLADPTRLLASATRLYGARMDELWGPMRAVPRVRLHAVPDGGEVRICRRRLRALATPGHAGHHHAWHENETGVVFSGDVAGIRLDRAAYVCAPTPPPEIDLDAWRRSLDRLASINPKRLLLTHFGGVDDVAWHLEELARRLDEAAAWMSRQAARGSSGAALAAALQERASEAIVAACGDPRVAAAYARAVPYSLMAAGLERWWRQHPGAPQAPESGAKWER